MPHAVVPETEHDLGVARQGEAAEHGFIIRNTGDGVLKIEGAELSPEAKAHYQPAIPPGQEGLISLQLPTLDLGDEVTAQGSFRINDAAASPVTLKLKARVLPRLIDVLPLPAAFISVFAGESGERVLTVQSHLERPLAVTSVEMQGKHFTAAVSEDVQGRVFRLTVTVPPSTAPGRYQEAVILHTDDPEHPRVRVPVNVLVKTDLYVNPDVADFGVIRLAELDANPGLVDLLAQKLLVKRRDGTFELRSVTCDVPALQLTRTPPDGAGQSFALDVRPERSKLKPGKLEGTMTIAASDPSFPELVVPVRGEVR